jgi:hypothetical protein
MKRATPAGVAFRHTPSLKTQASLQWSEAMQIKWVIVLLLVIAVGLYIAFACSGNHDDDNDKGNDDDDPDDDNNDTTDYSDDDSNTGETDDDWDGYCTEHQGDEWEPILYGIELLVNGEPVEMPTTVKHTDTIAIAIEYEDPDCDIWKAGIVPEIDEPDATAILETLNNPFLLPGIGCSSEAEGGPYLLNVETSRFLFPQWVERTQPLKFNLIDNCSNINDKTETQYLDFTVVYDW